MSREGNIFRLPLKVIFCHFFQIDLRCYFLLNSLNFGPLLHSIWFCPADKILISYWGEGGCFQNPNGWLGGICYNNMFEWRDEDLRSPHYIASVNFVTHFMKFSEHSRYNLTIFIVKFKLGNFDFAKQAKEFTYTPHVWQIHHENFILSDIISREILVKWICGIKNANAWRAIFSLNFREYLLLFGTSESF